MSKYFPSASVWPLYFLSHRVCSLACDSKAIVKITTSVRLKYYYYFQIKKNVRNPLQYDKFVIPARFEGVRQDTYSRRSIFLRVFRSCENAEHLDEISGHIPVLMELIKCV